MNYPKGGPLSFVEESQEKWVKKGPACCAVCEKKRAKREAVVASRDVREVMLGGSAMFFQRKVDRILSMQRFFFEQAEDLRKAPTGTQRKMLDLLVVYADDLLSEVGEAERGFWEVLENRAMANAKEEELVELDRMGDLVREIGDSVRSEMSKLSSWVSLRAEEILNRPSEKDTEEMPVPMTADEAMAEMKRLSDALDEAKKKAKQAVDYEKSTAKMAAIGSVGLGLFSTLVIASSASGFLPGLALIISIVGTVFFALAFVGALDKVKKAEEQWESPIKIWEDDLAKATSEWLKLEGIYDFSNPEIP